MNINGLTGTQLKQYTETLIKANNQQIIMMQRMIQREHKKREQTQNKTINLWKH